MASASNIIELTKFPVVVQSSSSPDTRYPGQLLGRVSESRLLISLAENPNLKGGDKIIVRTLQEGHGKVHGFETTIREIITDPVTLYFLEIPANVEVKSLRKSDRLNVFIPAEIRIEKNQGASDSDVLLFQCTVLNLSSGGCQVFSKRKVSKEALVNLSFTLPGERRSVNLDGRVLETFTQNQLLGLRVKFFTNERNLQDLNDIKVWLTKNQVFTEV